MSDSGRRKDPPPAARSRGIREVRPALRVGRSTSGLTAREVMHRGVVTVSAEMTIEEVRELFQFHNISGVPVVDDDGMLLGIITEDDLVYGQMGFTDQELHRMEEQAEKEWLARKGRKAEDVEKPKVIGKKEDGRRDSHTVGEVMTANPIAGEEEMSLEELCHLMWNYRIHRLPIVRQGQVTGIVSTSDLCRLVTEGRIRILPAET